MSLTKNQEIILKAFEELPIHPTAEQMHEFIRQKNPSIGLATIYRVLGRLVEMGKIQKISGLDNKEHYDHMLHSHPHFICTECGRVFHVPVNLCLVPIEKIEQSMQIECSHIELNIQGVCSSCKQKQENKNGIKRFKN